MTLTNLEKWLWGGAITGLVVALPLAGVMPRLVSTLALAGTFATSGALLCIDLAGQGWKRFSLAQTRIKERTLEAQLAGRDSLNQAIESMSAAQALKDWVCENVPVEAWEYWFNRYQIAAICQPEIAAAREALGYAKPPVRLMEPTDRVIEVPASLAEQQPFSHDDGVILATDWFGKWMQRSGVVCGESKDGKSFLLNYAVAEFLEQHQGWCKVYIGDLHYGAAHEDSEPNTWMDLPVNSMVFIEFEQVQKLILDVAKEVENRVTQTTRALVAKQPKPDFKPVLLVIDELPSVAAKIRDDAEVKAFQDAIYSILVEGIKFGVTFKIGTQSLASGRIKLPTDTLRQVEVVMLYRAAQVPENYRNLGLRDNQAQRITAEVAALPKIVNGVYVAATFLEKKLEVQGIPTLGKSRVVFVPEAPDPQDIEVDNVE